MYSYNMTLDNHVQAIVHKCSSHLSNLRAIASNLSYELKRYCLSTVSSSQNLIIATVSSMDYLNQL